MGYKAYWPIVLQQEFRLKTTFEYKAEELNFYALLCVP